MFDHFVWSVVIVPLLVLAFGHLLADRLRPEIAVRVFAWTTLVTGAAAALNLASFAVKAIAEVPAVAVLGGWSYRTVASDTAQVPWVPFLCLTWCVAASVQVGLVIRRRRQALRVANRLAAALPGGEQVVVVASESVDAFALPGNPGRIVITAAMRDLLGADELAAVIAHERGHLTQRHHDLVWLASLGAAVHPVLTSMIRRVEYLAERTADETAATTVGDRQRVAEALGVVALHTSGADRHADVLHIGSRLGQTPRRVLALLDTPVKRRYPMVVPALLAMSTVVWTGECVYDLQELLRFAT